MAWRGVHITQPSRLTLADGQIVFIAKMGSSD